LAVAVVLENSQINRVTRSSVNQSLLASPLWLQLQHDGSSPKEFIPRGLDVMRSDRKWVRS
ncbi:Hypothetical predicted protein, partial [Olea europaea subsp. europaea]